MDIDDFFTLDDNLWIDDRIEVLPKKSAETTKKLGRKPLTTEQKEANNLKKRKEREDATQIKNHIIQQELIISDLNGKLMEVMSAYETDKIGYFKLLEILGISQNNEFILREENNKLQIKLEHIAGENNKLIVIQSKLEEENHKKRKLQDEYNILQDKLDDVFEENITLQIKLIDRILESKTFV